MPADKAVSVRIAFEGAENFIRQLKRSGDEGERALNRLNRATQKPAKGLKALDDAARRSTQGFKTLGSAITLIDGPLGGIAARFNLVGASIQRVGVLATAAATAVGTAILGIRVGFRAAREDIAFGDEIAKTADRVGLMTESLQELQFAFQRGGTSREEFITTLGRMRRRLGQVSRGAGQETKKALDAIGVSLRDNNGQLKDFETLLLDVADGLSEISDEGQRLSIVNDIAGRSGEKFANTLALGAEAIQRLRQEARDVGFVIPDELLRQSENFADRLLAIEGAMQAITTQITLEMAPALIEWEKLQLNVATAINDTIQMFKELENQSTTTLERRLGRIEERLRGLREQGGPGLLDVLVGGGDIVQDLEAEAARIEEILARREAARQRPRLGGRELPDTSEQEARERAVEQVDNMIASLERQATVLSAEKDDRAALTQILQAESILRKVGLELTKDQRIALEGLANQIQELTRIEKEAAEAERERLRQQKEAEREAARQRKRGEQILISVQTPLEAYNRKIAELSELLKAGAINQETFNRALTKAGEEYQRAAIAADPMLQVLNDMGQAAIDSGLQALQSAENWTEAMNAIEQALLNVGTQAASAQLGTLVSGLFGPTPGAGTGIIPLAPPTHGPGGIVGAASGGRMIIPGGASTGDSRTLVLPVRPQEEVTVRTPEQRRQTVTNNRSMSFGDVIVNVSDAGGMGPEQIADAVQRGLIQASDV